MSKKYLFIGGPKDGERLFTNGVPEVRFPSQISSLGEIKPDDVLSDTVYCLHESYGPNGQEVAFYAYRKLSYTDTLQMLIDNYQPKPVVSGEEIDWNKKIDWAKESECMRDITVIGDKTLDALKKLKGHKFECKSEDYLIRGDGVKPPETGVFMVEIEPQDLLCAGNFFKKAYQPKFPYFVLVFEDVASANNAMKMKDDLGHHFYHPKRELFFGFARWCIKGQEDKIYPDGE